MHSSPTPNIVVENCLIKELKITNVAINLQLKKSGIFNLNIPGNSLYNFDVDGGFILNIQCPATYQSNPISGSVTIKNAHLGTKKINGKLAEAQGYRNIRHHLQQLQNPLAASKFHAAELRTDRETDDNWISKLVSYFYDWFSGYGNSISQPIFWFFGLMIAFTLATFFFDDPVLIDDSIKGWKSILAADDCRGKLARAWTNTLQNTLNPLGILGYKSIVIPNHWWFIPINIVYNLFSIILIALTILAIRRRFRIQSSN